MKNRASIQPIQATIPEERQKLARYYGVHPYFTRRSANVVQSYIARYSFPGDTVIDPFGGSGVTAIEAFLMGRRAMHNDLNPLSNFIVKTVADTTLPSTGLLKDAFQRVETRCKARIDSLETGSESDARKQMAGLALPPNIKLARNSDAECFHDLFTPKQMAALAILKTEIGKEKNKSARDHLLLAWSATATKLNKTFISAKGRAESRGGSSIFSIYRYKLAKQVVELPMWETFRGRFSNVVAATDEVLKVRDHYQAIGKGKLDSARDLLIYQKDAGALTDILGKETVDYVFTDPPYGAFIAYLDLSTLWNNWLGLKVSDRMRKAETIVGGECRLSEDHYRSQLARSVRTCIEILKPDRWFSIVFQHWDVSYFETILNTATGNGMELRSAVTQERDVIWSMHKKKHSESLLAGEMILTFYKPSSHAENADRVCEKRPQLLDEMLDELLKDEIDNLDQFTSQYLFNKLVLHAWRSDSLSQLTVSRTDFADSLRRRGWRYDTTRHVWERTTRRVQRELQLD